jgi:glycosyltransferase involved in cell wall biosynthesis
MKIAFISRSTLFSVPGGDTRQMQKTAEYLAKEGVDVDILLSNAVIDYSKYDLLHFFNITRPADIIKHIDLSGKPFVVSPIFVEYGRFNEKNKGFLSRTISRLFSTDNLLYLKSIARWIINGEKIISMKYMLFGQRRSVSWIAKRAACLLPNSEHEMQRFKSKYGINCPYHVVPNGVDTVMASKNVNTDFEYKDSVICMARFEPLKTQLSLIKALNNTSYKVFLHGKPAPNHHSYYQQCSEAAADNIKIRDWLDHEETLFNAYGNAKVHVLPSHFETTGLVSLEAAVMGCNIVVTNKGDQRSYFGDDVWYCEPDDPESIKNAVDAAYNAPYNPALRDRILKQYTWEHAAEHTLQAYKKAFQIIHQNQRVNYRFNFEHITPEYRRFVFEGYNEK